MSIRAWINRHLGNTGLSALAVLGCLALVQSNIVLPLRERVVTLDDALKRTIESNTRERASAAGPSRNDIQSFYAALDRKESTDIWLAKLYGIARASGLDWHSADYRLLRSRGRIERYEIRLPVTGSYAQIRAFLEVSLAEIPLLSIDQATFHRRSLSETTVDADVTLTLHRVHL